MSPMQNMGGMGQGNFPMQQVFPIAQMGPNGYIPMQCMPPMQIFPMGQLPLDGFGPARDSRQNQPRWNPMQPEGTEVQLQMLSR